MEIVEMKDENLVFQSASAIQLDKKVFIKVHPKNPNNDALYRILFSEFQNNSKILQQSLQFHYIPYETANNEKDYVYFIRPYLEYSLGQYIFSLKNEMTIPIDVKRAELDWINYQLERIKEKFMAFKLKHSNLTNNNIFIGPFLMLCIADAIPQANLYYKDDIDSLQRIQSLTIQSELYDLSMIVPKLKDSCSCNVLKIYPDDVNRLKCSNPINWNPENLYQSLHFLNAHLTDEEVLACAIEKFYSERLQSQYDSFFILKLIINYFQLTNTNILYLLKCIQDFRIQFPEQFDDFLCLKLKQFLEPSNYTVEQFLIQQAIADINQKFDFECQSLYQIKINKYEINKTAKNPIESVWIMHRFYAVDGKPNFIFWTGFFLVFVMKNEITIFSLENANKMLLCRASLRIISKGTIKQSYSLNDKSFVAFGDSIATIYTIEYQNSAIIGHKEKNVKLNCKYSLILNGYLYTVENNIFSKYLLNDYTRIVIIDELCGNFRLKLYEDAIFISSSDRLIVYCPEYDLILLDCFIYFNWDSIGRHQDDLILFKSNSANHNFYRFKSKQNTFETSYLNIIESDIVSVQNSYIVANNTLFVADTQLHFKFPINFCVQCPSNPHILTLTDSRGACFLMKLEPPASENS